MTHPVVIAAFSDELSKLSAAPPLSAVAAEIPKLKIPYKDLGLMGAGAAGLYGAHRLYQDVATGEQMRKQQSMQRQWGY